MSKVLDEICILGWCIVNFQFVCGSFLQSYYIFNIAEGKTSLFSLRKVLFCKNLVNVNTKRNQYYNIIETLKKKTLEFTTWKMLSSAWSTPIRELSNLSKQTWELGLWCLNWRICRVGCVWVGNLGCGTVDSAVFFFRKSVTDTVHM